MADITDLINEIMDADTGADVRGTIADALEALNETAAASGGETALETLWNYAYPDDENIDPYTGDWTDDVGDEGEDDDG